MSRARDIAHLFGGDVAEARKWLDGISWLDEDDKTAAAIKLKSIEDAELEKLTRDELKELYVAIGKLLKKPTAQATAVSGKVIKLTYKSKYKSLPGRTAREILNSTVSQDIEVIEGQRTEEKKKARYHSALELSCEGGIAKIQEWRREHGWPE